MAKLKCLNCEVEVTCCEQCGKKLKHKHKIICDINDHFCSYECEDIYYRQDCGEGARAVNQ